jgi:hypothetical protein
VGSEPGQSRTLLNSRAAAPSVAAKLRTTVATSSTGASTERSSTTSTSRMTTSTAGMITVRSRFAVSCASYCSAVGPPTRTSGPTASSACRSLATVSVAASLSPASARVTWTWPRPPEVRSGAVGSSGRSVTGAADATPSVASARRVTSATSPAGASTTAGVPDPPGKCRERAS